MLMADFGEGLRWRFVMGGLAREVAPEMRPALMEEWLRVSDRTGAPLDPLLWADAPLATTYPACMAVKAATEQAADGGYAYLRRLREALFCERRKLDGAEALIDEAGRAGLDVERFRIDLSSHAITEAFGADLDATEALSGEAACAGSSASRGRGGTSLPTAVFGEGHGRRVVAGLRPYADFRAAALEAGAEPAGADPLDVESALARFGRLTTREVELLCDLPGPRAAAELWGLTQDWKAKAVTVLTGHLWERA